MHCPCLGRIYHFVPSLNPSIKHSTYYRRSPLLNAKDSIGGSLHSREGSWSTSKKRSEMTVGAMGNITQGKDDKQWW